MTEYFNFFQVTGFNIISSVLKTSGGDGISGVRVLLDGEPVATTDATGQYALKDLKPNTYTLKFQHGKSLLYQLCNYVNTYCHARYLTT